MSTDSKAVSGETSEPLKGASSKGTLNRRNILLAGTAIAATSALASAVTTQSVRAQQTPPVASGRRPNILVIFGDDIGTWNVSAYCNGMMGWTPNIDRVGKEG